MKRLLIGTLLVLCTLLSAVYSENYQTTITQPNGKTYDVLVTGDEYFRTVTDKDNYTLVVEVSTGFWTYGIKSGGELVASNYYYGMVNPQAVGITPGLKFTREQIETRVDEVQELYSVNRDGRTPNTGTFNNLVVFIRFSGDSEYNQNLSIYSSMISDTTPNANTLINYFEEASFNQLTIASHYYPTPSSNMVVSYQDSHPRSYYLPYSSSNTGGYDGDSERTDREFDLLESAINAVESQVPASLNIDADNDGYVDNVVFITKGDTGAWSDLLWPHRWVLYDRNVDLNGKQVWDFNFQLQTHLVSSGAGVLCHEMFHSVGAPDLYHYNYDGMSPAGPWDLMEQNSNPPQHMLMYMKYRYGLWLSNIPEITSSGTYTLNPTTNSTNNVYKIASNDPDEYYVVEYRRATGTFESSLPGEGLLAYRINNNLSGDGNADGPPDELYIYRPGGTTSANGTVNSAVFNPAYGRDTITDYTDPNGFNSDGSLGGLNITNIGTAGNTISFYVNIGGVGAPEISVTPTSVSASLPIDGTITRSVRVSNTGTAPLNFNVSLQDGSRDGAGPDAAGYYWSDSDETNGPTYVWNDITSQGTEINYTSDDQMSSSVNLGFDFPFYTNVYSTMVVCSNGFLTFSDSDTEWDNEDIPTSGSPNNIIAPFWDDMSPQNSGSVHYYNDTANDRFVVQFTDSPHYNSVNGTYTFQVHLHQNGDIYFYYDDMQDTIDSATIGIENSDGSSGVGIAFNQTYMHDNLAVAIKNVNFGGDDVDWLDSSVSIGTVNPDNYTDIVLTFDSTGSPIGSYQANVVLNTNDADDLTVTTPITMSVVGGFDAPENATASVINGQLVVQWSPVSGATSYKVYQQNSSNGLFYDRSSYGTFGTSGSEVIWTTVFDLGSVAWTNAFFYVKAVAE
ncbi:MAG: M6 family metalloprotease domain-containing protein [Candidatus Zophobacter franzmannii]|nr:M6 family metalloprotease domain-containing protein [Candidatus Zophobacter franzmannii]